MTNIIEIEDIPPNARLIDARFRLSDPKLAVNLYKEAHIPGATFVDLESDLSGRKTGQNGRHPLPSEPDLVRLFCRLGIDQDTPVVAYDDTDHSGAARLWMLLRWMGHEKVYVLNGGLSAWRRAGKAIESGETTKPQAKNFTKRQPLINFVSKEQILGRQLVDARAPERYRGEVEPIDPKAGHIPGAVNLYYKRAMSNDGKFLPLNELRALLNFEHPVFYCGSGVTAAVLLLIAAELEMPSELYPGSWSEWCATNNAPIELG